MSWLKEQRSLLVEFLGSDFRRTFLLCAAGMLLAALGGFGTALAVPEMVDEVLEAFLTQIEEAGVLDESGQMSVFALLFNNWRAMVVSAAYGFIPFLFLPVLSLLVNGMLVGVMGGWVLQGGGSLPFFLAGILPHGVFELPALVLSIACGVTLCQGICRMIVGSPKKVSMVELLGDLLRVLVLLVAPLTVIAAFVECYVTPVVMGFFM